MNYKELNRGVYDSHAEEFEKKRAGYIEKYILEDAEEFVDSLPGKRVLDLGSGPGRDSVFLINYGIHTTCLDISQEMIRLCREKGLVSLVGDLENLPFPNNTFHGIWAYASLLHVPKRNFPIVLKNLNGLLKNQGTMYIGMKEGNSEGIIKSEKYGGKERFFALYEEKELQHNKRSKLSEM